MNHIEKARDLAAYPGIQDTARDYATNIGSGTAANRLRLSSIDLRAELRSLGISGASLAVCREIIRIAAPEYV